MERTGVEGGEHAADRGSWFDQLPAAAAILAPDGTVLRCNAGASKLLGLRGSSSPQAVRWVDRLKAAMDDEGTASIVVSRRRGPTRDSLRVHGRMDAEGNVVVLLRERSARSRARECLSATHDRLRLITDVVRDHAILYLDTKRAITSWNTTAEQLTGYATEDVVRRPITIIASGSVRTVARAFEAAARGGRQEAEIGILRRDGSVFRARMTLAAQSGPAGRVVGYTMILRDLSERLRAEEDLRRSEEQLRHSQKMDAVGRLASGIAHDFNNVLTAIQGHVQFLLEDLPEDMPSREDATEIRRAAERATQLTRQLLTFARRQPTEPVEVDVNDVITDVEKLLRRLIRADIQLEKELAPVPVVFADPGQLEQVIMNLVVNARDAMDEGGTITIRTACIQLDQTYAARGLHLTPGAYVQMSISDTGRGMPPDVQRRIFEPFFTTKEEGTGLGLSTVYGIAKQSDGQVSVYSEEGVGTTFKVFLPVHAGEGDFDRPPREQQRRENGARTGSVLLVEDDDAVRALARRTLEGHGFSVVEATDGDEALCIVTRAGHAFDVLVTDLMMPRMNGEDLAARVLEIYPEAGIVLMSGFPESALAREGRIRQHRHFLEKPFTPESLTRIVRQALPS